MVVATLLLGSLVNLAAAAVFVYVGGHFRPGASGDGGGAARAFRVYWTGLGLYTAYGGVMDALASVGWTPFPAFLAARLVSLPVISAALAGLSYYFLYLFTGNRAWLPVSAAAYMVACGVAVYYVWSRIPAGVAVYDWRTDIAYANPYETPALDAILLIFVLPPLVGSLAYGTLALRVASSAARYRIVVVSSAIFLSTVGAVVARVADTSQLVQLLSRPVLGALVAAAVLAAYRPPLWVPMRYRIG
jgi:hypothetical protein